MNNAILVLNAGSNSLKYKLFRGDVELLSGHIDGIGVDGTSTLVKKTITQTTPVFVKNYDEAVQMALHTVHSYVDPTAISHVLHRVVHGGEYFANHTIIDTNVEKHIEELCTIAPIHNPANLAGIRASRKVLPHAMHIAFFDTAFHHTIPKHVFLYGLPYKFYEEMGIRKYGFHGLSHQYIAQRSYEISTKADRLISCHLGSGSSLTAIHHGKSLDTTMGFTPLDGILMATRTGELDPDIPLFLIKHGYTVDQVSNLLHKEAGMKGLVGTGDLREIKKRADAGDPLSKTVIDMLCYRVATFIGGLNISVGGVRTIVFTGGIGEHADFIRQAVCKLLEPIGVLLDEEANKRAEQIISAPTSRVTVLIIPANEELQMVRLFLAGTYVKHEE